MEKKAAQKIKDTLPKHYKNKGLTEKASLLIGSCWGLLLLSLGKEPPKPITPKLAVNKWIHWFHKNKDSLPPTRGSIIILALRNQSWTDWAFYTACWMRRLGFAPIVLFSQQDIDKIYGIPEKQTFKQKVFFGSLWKQLDQIPDVISIDVDEMQEPSTNSLSKFNDYAEKQAHTNAAYELLTEEYETGPLKEKYDSLVKDIKASLLKETAQAYELLSQLKSQYDIKRLLGFSGTIGRSACYEGAAKEMELPRVWVEGWSILPSLMRYNINKPALNFNAKEWVEKLEWNKNEQAEMEKFLAFQETNKGDESKKDHLQYQIVNKETEWPPELTTFMKKDDRPLFLMATNVVGDSATFQRQTIFESQRAWITNVIQHFKNHPDKRLIIRAHPSERVYELQGNLNINLGQIANELASKTENIYVVQWQDPINTYSLIPHCRAGLTWVSNTGVDMVIRNVPVISAANPIYSGLGITEEPASKKEYFSWIEQLGQVAEKPTKQQKEMGGKYLYVIYKKIGFKAHGPRYKASGLLLAHPLTSEYAQFYRIIAGLK